MRRPVVAAVCWGACCLWGGLAYGGAGNGISVGGVVIEPALDLKAGYESNVKYSPTNEQDDVRYSGKVSLNLSNKTETIHIQGGAWGFVERFFDLTEENHEDFGQNFRAQCFGREQVQVTVNETYDHIQSLDYGVGQIEARDVWNTEVAAGRDLTDKVDADATYGFKLTEYDSPSLYDWSEHWVRGEASHLVTDKSALLLALKGGIQQSDANTEDGKFVAILVGAKSKGSDKLSGRAGIGWLGYNTAKDLSTVIFDLGLKWKMTRKVTLAANASNGVEPATQNRDNVNLYARADVSLSWELSQELKALASVRYMRNDLDQEIEMDGTWLKKQDDTYTGVLQLTYAPPARCLEVFLETKADDKTATINENEYDQFSATVGMNLKY